MRAGISKFLSDIRRIFSLRNLGWHILAIALTYVLVVTGFDWWVTNHVRDTDFFLFARSAGIIGFFVPVAVPLILFLIGGLRRNKDILITGLLIAQAEITGLLVSFFYKALTGRPGPVNLDLVTTVTDTSTVFNFGFLRGGVFWGWPSSHITVALAGAVLLMVLYRKKPLIKYLALFYAIYMAASVSITFHWFSDGVAGVIFGSLVGAVVAKSVLRKK